MKIPSKLAVMVAAFLTASCDKPETKVASPPEKETPQATKLSPAQLKEMIEGKGPYFFLDVRSAEEIATLGTLEGYVNIPIDDLEKRLGEIPKDIPIVTA